MKIQTIINLIASAWLITMMWMDVKWALYLTITLLAIGSQVNSYLIVSINKRLRGEK